MFCNKKIVSQISIFINSSFQRGLMRSLSNCCSKRFETLINESETIVEADKCEEFGQIDINNLKQLLSSLFTNDTLK